jgi:hypothetical protein
MNKIHDGIYCGEDLFTPEEIECFTKIITTAQVGSFNGELQNRNGKMVYPEIANLIGKRILQSGFSVNGVSFSDILYFSEIEKNQPFFIHTDTGVYYNRKTNVRSRYTVLLYLNDNFDGGNTSFYTNEFKKSVSITAKKNKIVVFDISLFHSGDTVTSGTKRWIGTELIGPFPEK